MSIILVDSYSESNQDSSMSLYVSNYIAIAQSFTGDGNILDSCKFYLKKVGSPTGNAVAKIYAHTGTFGVDGKPTGAAIATSDNLDVSTLTTSLQLITFNFTGANKITLINGTKYVVSVEYGGGDISNRVVVGIDITGSTHPGNRSYLIITTWYSTSYDVCFYVYAEYTAPPPDPEAPSYSSAIPDIKSIATPIKLTTTKEINGAWTASMQILPDDYIGTESYVDIDDGGGREEYIVKDIKGVKSGGQYYYDVSLFHNMIELADLTLERFSLLKSPSALLTFLLAGTGWTAGTCDINEITSLITDRRTSVLEALNTLADNCGGELYYHSKTRIVDLKRQIGNVTKLQLRYDKNCDYIEKEEDSSDLITRIYPYGPDNFTLNTTIIDDCEDETLYIASGAGTKVASDLKQQGSQGIQINPAAQYETFIRTLGTPINLTDHDLLKFWIYSAVDNAAGFTFGIGNVVYTTNTKDTGVLTAGCWHEIEYDISGVANANKNAIIKIGFNNLTNGATSVVFDRIEAFDGEIYIDSDNKALYKVNKEYVYNHSAKPQKTQFEVLIYPSADAVVREHSPNTNYGNDGTVEISGVASWRNYAYFKFLPSLIPTGATIVSATIYLNVAIANAVNANTYQPTATWVENTITWNNKPANDAANINTWNFNALGEVTGVITATFNSWYGGANNYGIVLISTDASSAYITSKEGTAKPYIKVVYTMLTDPSPVILAAAMDYLAKHELPALSYKGKMTDLSHTMVDTWEDESIGIGDTVRMYDTDLGLNVDVRVVKITKDLLNADNVALELANKAYTLADVEAKRAKQLAYAMPYQDTPTIISANAIQTGYFGSKVNV